MPNDKVSVLDDLEKKMQQAFRRVRGKFEVKNMAGSGLEYKGVASISGPIIVVENVQDVGYDELVAVKMQTGETTVRQSYSSNSKSRNRPSLRRHNRLVAFRNAHSISWKTPGSARVNRNAWARYEQFRRTHRRAPEVLH